jgi:hypothetical protein
MASAPTPSPLRRLADPIKLQVMPSSAKMSSSHTALSNMPPPPPKPHAPVRVEEDAYERSLGNIIQRDFYPDLPKLQQQLEWIQALESGDPYKVAEVESRIAASAQRLDRLAVASTPHIRNNAADLTDSVSVIAGGTDELQARASEDGSSREAVAHRAETAAQELTLGQFQDRFVAEDTASFEDNFVKRGESLQRKHWWLYEHNDPKLQKMLLLDGNAVRAVKTVGNQNFEGVDVSKLQAELTDGDPWKMDHGGLLNTWKYRPTNALYFQPNLHVSRNAAGLAPLASDAVLKEPSPGVPLALTDSQKQLLIEDAGTEAQEMVRYVKANGGLVADPVVRASRTRTLPSQRALTTKGADQLAEDSNNAGAHVVAGPDAKPTVRGYDFVSTPQVISGLPAAAPPMVWGSLSGPAQLSASQQLRSATHASDPAAAPKPGDVVGMMHLSRAIDASAGPQFTLPQTSRREDTAERVTADALERKRKRLGRAPVKDGKLDSDVIFSPNQSQLSGTASRRNAGTGIIAASSAHRSSVFAASRATPALGGRSSSARSVASTRSSSSNATALSAAGRQLAARIAQDVRSQPNGKAQLGGSGTAARAAPTETSAGSAASAVTDALLMSRRR